MLNDLPTPALIGDETRLERNIAAMTAHAAELGVALRPHAKTHKSPDIARRQVDAGAVGLTVATLSEAVVFAEAGFTDLFVAYPLWLDATKEPLLRRLLELAVTLTVGCDSVEAGRRFAGAARVLVEVDSGQHRTGATADHAGEIAARLHENGVDVAGVFTHPGHAYAPGAGLDAARDEEETLAEAAAALKRRGIEPRVVSGGATPSIGHAAAGVLTEARPGVYVFNDAQQWELGSCGPDDIALTCLATVVSRQAGRVALDSGSKALGADKQAWASGYGRLLDWPEARIVRLSEHHAVVEGWENPPELGERVRVVPNHVCNAVNLAEELVVVRDGVVQTRWPVAAGGCNV